MSMMLVWVATAVAVSLLAAVTLDLWPCFVCSRSGDSSSRRASAGFRAQRLAVWLPTGFMYALFYCGRYAVAAGGQSPIVQEKLGLGQGDFAVITSCGFWAYAATAPVTGKLCDYLGVRRGMLLSSAGFVTTNLLAGAMLESGVVRSRSALRLVLALLYSLNFVLQGIGAIGGSQTDRKGPKETPPNVPRFSQTPREGQRKAVKSTVRSLHARIPGC